MGAQHTSSPDGPGLPEGRRDGSPGHPLAKGLRSRERLDVRMLRFWNRPGSEEPAMLAQDLVAAGRVEEALRVTEVALHGDPEDAEVVYARALAWLGGGQLVRAQLAFTVAAKLDPDWPEPWQQLGEVLMRRERFDRASTVLDRARALGGDGDVLARLHGKAHRLRRSGRRLARFRSSPGSVEPAMLAQDLLDLGRVPEALEVTEVALVEDDDDADLLLLHARALLASGNASAARTALERATRVAGDWKEPWAELARVLFDDRDLHGAQEAAGRALVLDMDDPAMQDLASRVQEALQNDSGVHRVPKMREAASSAETAPAHAARTETAAPPGPHLEVEPVAAAQQRPHPEVEPVAAAQQRPHPEVEIDVHEPGADAAAPGEPVADVALEDRQPGHATEAAVAEEPPAEAGIGAEEPEHEADPIPLVAAAKGPVPEEPAVRLGVGLKVTGPAPTPHAPPRADAQDTELDELLATLEAEVERETRSRSVRGDDTIRMPLEVEGDGSRRFETLPGFPLAGPDAPEPRSRGLRGRRPYTPPAPSQLRPLQAMASSAEQADEPSLPQ